MAWVETGNEEQYLELLYYLRHDGKDRSDRTGVGTRGSFGHDIRYDLRHNFPLLTTKKIDLKSVSSELLWFLEGSGNERRLAEIRYGKSRSELIGKNTIWTANAEAPYWRERGLAVAEGDLGRVYGQQWRQWQTPVTTFDRQHADYGMRTTIRETDQIAILINGLRDDPYSRRHILTAWNPGELDQMALPPCHVMSQFYVDDGELSCKLTQRSCDYMLGAPYNIASYALLTCMLAQVCGLKPGDFIHSMGDAHVYANHFDAVDEQLLRDPRPAPTLIIDPSVNEIDDFTMESFTLEGYDPYPAIRAPMAV